MSCYGREYFVMVEKLSTPFGFVQMCDDVFSVDVTGMTISQHREKTILVIILFPLASLP